MGPAERTDLWLAGVRVGHGASGGIVPLNLGVERGSQPRPEPLGLRVPDGFKVRSKRSGRGECPARHGVAGGSRARPVAPGAALPLCRPGLQSCGLHPKAVPDHDLAPRLRRRQRAQRAQRDPRPRLRHPRRRVAGGYPHGRAARLPRRRRLRQRHGAPAGRRATSSRCGGSWLEGRPFFGICIGLQTLFEGSEESLGRARPRR